MKTIEITAPDGKIIELNAPDDATPEKIREKVEMIKQQYLSQAPQEPKQEKPGILQSLSALASQGTQDPISQMGKMGLNAASGIQNMLDQGGEDVATSLAGSGMKMRQFMPGMPSLPTHAKPGEEGIKTGPKTAAAIGTVIAKSPDIVGAITGLSEAKATAEGIRAVVKAGLKRLKPENKIELLQKTADDIHKEIQKMAQMKADIPLTNLATKKAAMEGKSAAGKAIQEFEAKAGYKFSGSPEIPENFIDTAKKLSTMKPEELAQMMDKQGLQDLYKVSDVVRGSANKYDKVILDRARSAITDAQELVTPGIKEVRSKFGESAKAIEGLGDQFKMSRASVASQLKRKQIAYQQVQQELKALLKNKDALKKYLKKAGIGLAQGAGIGGTGVALGWLLK